MTAPTDGDEHRREQSGQPSVTTDVAVGEYDDGQVCPAIEVDAEEELTPSEAFQTLANEVRIAVLLELLAAERAGETPLSFSSLQAAVEADSSAGFAYHLRQLAEHFIHQQGEEKGEGYVLTPAGRRAAKAVLEGTFTGGHGGQAS